MNKPKLIKMVSPEGETWIWWTFADQSPYFDEKKGVADFACHFEVDAVNSLKRKYPDVDVSNPECVHIDQDHPDYRKELTQTLVASFWLPLDELTEHFAVGARDCPFANSLTDDAKFDFVSVDPGISIVNYSKATFQLYCSKRTRSSNQQVKMTTFLYVHVTKPRCSPDSLQRLVQGTVCLAPFYEGPIELELDACF